MKSIIESRHDLGFILWHYWCGNQTYASHSYWIMLHLWGVDKNL